MRVYTMDTYERYYRRGKRKVVMKRNPKHRRLRVSPAQPEPHLAAVLADKNVAVKCDTAIKYTIERATQHRALTDRRRRLSAQDKRITHGVLPDDARHVPQRWVFIHIPKAAGASFLTDAQHFLTTGDTITGSEEKGAFSRTVVKKLGVAGTRAILLRRPAQLAYSQFLYCKHVLRGKVRDFPGHGISTPHVGLERWSRGDNKKVTADRGAFWKCYDPRNVQNRFVAGEGNALTLKGVPSTTTVRDAARRLDAFGFVGVVELYRESLCLLGWHVTQSVPSYCRCGADGPLFASFPPTSTTHREAYDSDLNNVPAAARAALEKLVDKDELLYLHGLHVFERATQACEAATGAKLVCPGKLEALWGLALADACPGRERYIRENYNRSCVAAPPRKSLGQKALDGLHSLEAGARQAVEALAPDDRAGRAMRHLKHVGRRGSS